MANTGSYCYGIYFPYRMHRKPSDRPAYIRKIRKLAADIVVWYAQEAAVFMPSRNDMEIGAPSIYFSFILAGCCHPERVDAVILSVSMLAVHDTIRPSSSMVHL